MPGKFKVVAPASRYPKEAQAPQRTADICLRRSPLRSESVRLSTQDHSPQGPGASRSLSTQAPPTTTQAPSKIRNPHSAIRTLLPLFLTSLLLFPSLLRAEGAPPTAIIPFDPDLPLSQQTPNQVYLDYATFQRLWNAAKETRKERGDTEEQNETAPDVLAAETGIDKPDTTLTTALYKAEASADSLSVTARLSLFARGKGVREFPLSFGSAAIDKISLGDAPAAYRDGKIILPGAGHHTVTVHFDLPLKKGWRTAEWKIPPAAAALLSLTLAESDGDPTVNRGIPLVESAGKKGDPAGVRTFTAALGSASTISLALTSRTRAHALAEPSLADIAARLFVTPALDRLEADFDFSFIGGEQDTFSFSFESDVTPVGVTVPDLKSWTLKDGKTPGTKILEFTLASPAHDRLQVGFTGERAASKIPSTAKFPTLGAGAARITRKLALLTVPEVKLIPRPPKAFLQVPLDTDTAGTGFRFIGAFESPTADATLPYDLTPGSLDRTAEAEIVFQVGRGKVETFAGFQLLSPESDLHTAIFDLPEDTAIESVLGNRIADWWRDGDALYLRFSGETPEVTTALIYLSRSVDVGENAALTLHPPFPRDFKEVTGTGILAAHAASDTLLRFDKPITAAREIAPDKAAQKFDFAIVPPFERKRGFSFEEGDFTATVTLSRLEPRFDVIWTMRADVHETWTVLSAFIDIEVKRSALNQATFTLPADLPEIRIDGEQIREITNVVKGELREYTASFQNDITDQVRFEISTESTHAGESDLPTLTFPQANRTEGFVIVDNYSKDRMAVTAQNATAATQDQLPYKPDYLISASIYRVQPDYAITAKLEELETTAGNRALVLYAEHTSALRKNGEVWTRSTYRLHNRSLQFLPVRIPAGSEVVGARVAGSNVRIDKAAGEAKNEILIPLIQTAPGQIAYDVELILLRPGNSDASVTRLNQKLEDPELIDVPVERTTWRVFLPEGFQLDEADGNMTEVSTQELGYARAESQLKELKKKVATTRSKEVTKFDRTANWKTANEDLAALDDYVRFNKPQAENGQILELERQIRAQRLLLEDQTVEEFGIQMDDQSGKLALPNGWTINPTAIGGRQKQIDEKRARYYEGIEGKLGLNDNVILGNRGILTKTEKESGKPGDIFGPPDNRSFDAVDPPTKKPATKGRATQLDRLDRNEEAAGEKGKSEELFRNQSEFLDQTGAAFNDAQQMPEPPKVQQMIGTPQPAQPSQKRQYYGAEQQAQTLDQGYTNNARFLNNTAIQQKNKEAQTRTPPPTNQPKPPNPVEPTVPGRQPVPGGRPGQGQSTGGNTGFGGGGGGGFDDKDAPDLGGQAPNQLKPEGRISLSIDFPTRGQPLVFSKLKAHADLTIIAQAPAESAGRLDALVAFAISIVVLFLLDRLLARRKKA